MSDKDAETKLRQLTTPPRDPGQRRRPEERSRSRSRSSQHGSRRRATRSRSRSHRYAHPRARRSRSRSRSTPRDRCGRSESSTRDRMMREQERELSRTRHQLRQLENEVRHERERLGSQNASPQARSGGSNIENIGQTDKESIPNVSRSEQNSQPETKKPRLDLGDASSFFAEFLNVLKNRAGDRESFSTLNNVVPEFDPLSKEQTMSVWLDKVDECSEIYGWSERQTIHYALPKLTGHARTWYQGLPSIKHTWAEWKILLSESFPATENYAELLTEMLNRRARPGESLEIYYFSKINLLNRCKIFGKQAVDCLVHGVDDRGVRVGAQAARFEKPEDVHEFFKTLKTHNRDYVDAKKDITRDRRMPYNASAPNFQGQNKDATNRPRPRPGPITCFNCNEVGHPSFKCPKPLVKCTTCNLIGHTASHCPKSKESNTQAKDKSILKVSVGEVHDIATTINDYPKVLVGDDPGDKYKIAIRINDTVTPCLVDLGSEATVIRESDAVKLNLSWQKVTGPLLRGFGNVPYLPLGRAYVDVDVQGVLEKDVEVYIVEDSLIGYNVLLGHSFTERPNVRIIKTATDLKFERADPGNIIKLPLMAVERVCVEIGEMKPVLVICNDKFSGNIYVSGSIRGSIGNEYYLLPGEYQMLNGECRLLVQNVGTKPITVEKEFLVTRAQYLGAIKSVLKIMKSAVTPNEEVSVKCGSQLSATQRQQCEDMLAKYKDCFSHGMHDLGFTTVTEMEIHLKDASPVVYRPYRLAHSERQLVQSMVDEMVEHGIVSESNSPYASPIVLVQKKSGEKRLCVDYRALNSRTKRDHYPLPIIEDLLDQLSGQSLFTSLDLASGYHQIPIAEESRHKTAFVTPDGQYEYNRMPFGLANAPAVFQRAIHKILSKSKAGYVIIYMDDILIPSKTFEEGLQRLEEVLTLIREAGLTLKMEKCKFFQEQIDFLGFQIDKDGIRPGVQKVEAVSKFPAPRNQHEVRRFIGLAGFFRRFVKGFALIARPLTNLLKKDVPWQWGEAESNAFECIKTQLTSRPILALYDHGAETQLHTDASKLGVAGILMQRKNGESWQPVAYFSRQTTMDEMKLHSFELETLAVISALNKFRTYLIGIKFTIITDCNALRSTFTKRDLIPRISRWWIQFLEFDCVIEYRPGEKMAHVDALSRAPITPCSEEIHTLDILTINTQDWISTVQSSDEEVKRIKDVLEDPDTPKIAEIHKTYELKNGRVFRILGEDNLKWLVPRGVRWQVLRANHDDVGHFGFEKTLQRVQALFWFPKMRKFIKKYVGACLECAHHKLPSGAKEGLLHPIPKVEIPFHTLHADHLGPFPRSKRGNTYILVIVDAFTKYVSLTPVRSTKSKESIKAFKTLFSYFGSPNRLITDRGTSFTSKKFKSFIQSVGSKHILNSVATPRANGQVERYNRTILASLGSMTHGKGNNTWDEQLPDVQLGINSTIHEVTKKTPTELLFGRKISNPAQGILNDLVNDVDDGTTNKNIEEMRSEAADLIRKNQEVNKRRYDSRRKKPTVYKEGDLVRIARAIVTGAGQSKKLESKCQGPYRIKKLLPNDRFLVEDTPLTRKGPKYESVVAIDKIFPWLSFGAPACSSNDDSDAISDDCGNE